MDSSAVKESLSKAAAEAVDITGQTTVNTQGDLARAEGDVVKTEAAARSAHDAFKAAQDAASAQDGAETT